LGGKGREGCWGFGAGKTE